MKFSLDNYRTAQIYYPNVFSMKSCLDKVKYAKMEEQWKNNAGKDVEEGPEHCGQRFWL